MSTPPVPRNPLSRRGILATAVGAATAAVLAGCGESGGDTASAADSAPGFPATVNGKLGRTTVTAPPKRVVACGYLRDTDLALALGANLVGATKNTVFPNGLAPWQRPSPAPTMLDTVDGLPMERIAALRPDLILASDDYSLAKDNAKLRQIAPTLGYATGVGEDGWVKMVRRAGTVLGRHQQAEKLVRSVQAGIDKARGAHPDFAGKTFTFGPVGDDNQINTISSAKDASATFFSQLGLKLSPKVTGLPQSSVPGRSTVSAERLDLLDADVLILTFTSDKARTTLEANELFQRLKAVKRGSYLALDMPTAVAVAFPSVLSIPYGLKVVLPKLTKALAKV